MLTGLAAAGFVRPGEPPAPANLALVLTGGAPTGIDAGDAAAVVARLAAQLDRAGAGAVLAGRADVAEATGAVGVARADPAVADGAVHRRRRADRLRAGVDRARPAPSSSTARPGGYGSAATRRPVYAARAPGAASDAARRVGVRRRCRG